MHNKIYGHEMEGQYEFAAEGMRLSLMSGHLSSFSELARLNKNGEAANALHTHFWYELFHVTRGRIRIQLENSSFEISTGEILIVAPDVLHYAEPIGEEDVEQYVFNFSITETEKTKASRALLSLLSFRDTLHIMADAICHRDATMIAASLLRRQGTLSGCYLLALLLRLATDKSLYRIDAPHRDRDLPAEEGEQAISDNMISRLYRLEHLFNDGISLHVSLESFAEEMHLSSRQLARFIRERYGCTYYEHMLRLRMKSAKKLLTDPALSIAEVAARVGYTTLGGFTTAFRKYFGVSPSAYRKQSDPEPHT